jgi:hypothetical protein
METQQVHKSSKSGESRTSKATNADLIRQIRIMEGNYACFANAGSAGCSQGNCPWRRVCLNVAQ